MKYITLIIGLLVALLAAKLRVVFQAASNSFCSAITMRRTTLIAH
jgi:hypothetical protein